MTSKQLLAATESMTSDAVAFLEQLVNLESPTEDKALCDKVAAVLADRARQLGLEVTLEESDVYGQTVIARLNGGGAATARPRVLCIGHYDTVFAAGTAAERPFGITDGHAFGPGVLDMKSGLTVALYGLAAVLATHDDFALGVTCIFNSDEEPGSPWSRELIARETGRHDLALIFEPSDTPGTVTVSRKGVGIFALEQTGAEAHAGAEPEAGANAIVDTAERTRELWALQRPEIGTTINPGVISGGTKPYVVPGACRLDIDIRVPTEAEQTRVEQGLAALVQRTYIPGVTSTLHGRFHRPPMEPDDRTQSYVTRLRAVADQLGRPLSTAASGAASDGNLTASAGVPTIDGMGAEGAGAHSDKEYIDLETLHAKTALFAGFLADLHRGGPVRRVANPETSNRH